MKFETCFSLVLQMQTHVQPDEVTAIGFDRHERVIYAAVNHNGFTSAVCATYDDGEIDGDDLDGEIEGSLKRNCPLSVLEKLSPLSKYPYSSTSKQFARQWRRDCLQRIIRSKRTSDADRAQATKLLQTI